jgi:hypothetical protein
MRISALRLAILVLLVAGVPATAGRADDTSIRKEVEVQGAACDGGAELIFGGVINYCSVNCACAYLYSPGVISRCEST